MGGCAKSVASRIQQEPSAESRGMLISSQMRHRRGGGQLQTDIFGCQFHPIFIDAEEVCFLCQENKLF